jgi:hypothetical protein
MKKIILLAVVASSAVALGAGACSSSSSGGAQPGTDSGSDTSSGSSGSSSGSSSSSGGSSGSSGSSSGGMEGGVPTPPALGAQIDRMGRPAINTALDHSFDPNTTTQGMAKDAYNADNMVSNWTTYVAEFKANLAIYDGLDTVCGNQAAYGALMLPDYTALATVLSQDALWVNTGSTTCQQYLGVELNALGISNTDCGGRTLTENVIDFTFNAVAGTYTANPPPVTNGITMPASAPSSTFPYMASPH